MARGYLGCSPLARQSFWPSFTAPAGQDSTQRPQATQFSGVTLAVYEERERLGVLKSMLVRRALQIFTSQLQMSKILFSPSMLVIWWTKPLSSARLRISSASSVVM